MIRWIRPKLGTAPHGELTGSDYAVIDVRHLVDKAGNPPNEVAELIDAGNRAYRSGRTVVVTCDFGVSRSNAVAAGILSVAETLPYDEALLEVRRATGESEIKLDLAAVVRVAVERGATAANGGRGSVLLTGGSGFVGSRLAAVMKDDVSLFTPARVELDLCDATAVDAYCRERGIGQLVHLAYPRVYTNAAAAGESITMLRCILDVCRLRKIRLVFVSGSIVLGGYATTDMIADENTPLRPKGIYGENKYLEERLLRLYTDRGDVEAIVCRFAPIYGPGGSRPRFLRTSYDAIQRGDQIATHRFRNGRPAMDLLYVDDAVGALRAAVRTVHNGVFHFGAGNLRTTVELARELAALAGKPLNFTEIPIDDFTSNVVLSSSKAKDLLAWTPEVALEEGLKKTLARPT